MEKRDLRDICQMTARNAVLITLFGESDCFSPSAQTAPSAELKGPEEIRVELTAM